MDLATATTYFDNQPVLDAYSGARLFYGQPDLYDASERDSETGWRRTVSAREITLPARGCVKLDDDIYLVGRVVKDFFQGENHRQHLLLQPVDMLFTCGATSDFLSAASLTPFYGALSWTRELKDAELTSEAFPVYKLYASWTRELKDAELTSEAFPVYKLYASLTETVSTGNLVSDADGNYYRAHTVSKQTGGLRVAVVYSLGAAALRSIQYSVSGDAYNSVTDSYGVAAPISVSALVEPYLVNYRFANESAAKFLPSDLVVSVQTAEVTEPKPGDTFVDGTVTYRVLECWAANGCWEIHARPV